MIPQRDLSLLSNRLAERGGRRIPETVLERDYCLSWFLVGLSRSPLRDRLAFKVHLDRHSHENSHTFYLAYEGPLSRARGKTVKTDITIRERIVLALAERPVLRGYEEYRDLPDVGGHHPV
ncbi:MAG TPA: hypothetical protein VJ386_12130 [Candidatus Deferrimicrobiaceae bacterium]|jgi:hypothetical protein|nr:MAG: hypothetical protein A2Z13_09335 [Deltaproteobacteria bacterium RBG_16_64_85]HJX16476.1 hypothetical protein [Candidatus Deferrimicrobiaceae bacterium]